MAARPVMTTVVRRFYNDLWNKFNPSVADEIISPSVTFRGTLEHGTTDLAGFKRYVREIQASFPDFHQRIDALYFDGEHCIARMHWSGTHVNVFRGIPGTNRRFEYPGVGIFTIRKGLICDCWVVGDTHGMYSVIKP